MQRPPPDTDRPGFLWWRYWFPGVVMAGLTGMLLIVLATTLGDFGFGAIMAAPVAIGCTLGYGLRVPPIIRVTIGLLLLGTLAVTAITWDLAGFLCALILSAMIAAPLFLGVAIGFGLRKKLKNTGFTQRHYLPVIFFISPAGMMYVEHEIASPSPIESIETTRIVPMTPQQAWSRMAFYEDIPADPPVLARIGLPHPLYTEGEVTAVGDIKRCVYDSGYLVKRITEFEPGVVLAFDVIEQHGIEDRSVRLVDGSFEFSDNGDGTTSIVLTTRYRPLLSARVFWRPFEVALTRTLHNHVLDGMDSLRPHRP